MTDFIKEIQNIKTFPTELINYIIFRHGGLEHPLATIIKKERKKLLDLYLHGYTPQNRLGFMKLVLTKVYWSNSAVTDNSLIVADQDIIYKVKEIVKSNKCSVEQFSSIFNKLSFEQIYIIGY
uniref:Uncharacterized protein n=1 Tax=Megaviridae environmental sample TaxID=1737588 RepID=A0A5J6VKU5_9VIRU|nr:MAG: hypothetical protein [Megaviridae environmental sample]